MKLTKKEALNEVAKVLQAALDEYEALEKMDFEGSDSEKEEDEEPSDEAQASEEDQESPDQEQEEQEAEGDSEEPSAESEMQPDEEGDKEDDKEMDDETLKSEYSKICAKMESRGFLKKSEQIKKTETTGEELKKYESQIDSLTKTVNELQASIKKISSTPAPRKGATGYSPLKKNTEGEAAPLNKGEAVNKLLDLKKSGNRNVTTGLINRLEGDRLTNEDVTTIKGLLA